jgi:hypothetical protein
VMAWEGVHNKRGVSSQVAADASNSSARPFPPLLCQVSWLGGLSLEKRSSNNLSGRPTVSPSFHRRMIDPPLA